MTRFVNRDIFINKNQWKHYTSGQMERYIERVFRYYVSKGFPYFPVDTEFRDQEMTKLKDFNLQSVLYKDVIRQTMHGLALAWSYMPHSWSIPCNNMITPLEAFNNHETLKRVIRKRIQMGDNMSDNGLRKMLKIFTGVQSVSNFRPTSAGALYNHFCSFGDTVLDMSSGFGGRLLGAHITGMYYIGIEPSTKTFNGLQEMCVDYQMSAEIHKMDSADYKPDRESIDFCFTSPPYFNLEKYSQEETQSYIKYPTKELWLNQFIAQTFTNCRYGLKKHKYMAVNIANTKAYPDLENEIITVANSTGFKLVNVVQLALSNINMREKKQGFKYEPIFIFQKS